MRQCLAFVVFLILSPSSVKAGFKLEERPSVAVKIAWKYSDIPEGMSLYEPATGKKLALWAMDVSTTLASAPVSTEIKDSTIHLRPGDEKTFLLVFHNATDKTVRFFAAPHQAHPAKHSLGFEFHCLCLNHVYTVPPGEYWHRVVRFSLDRRFKSDRLEIKHELVNANDDSW